MAPTLILQIEVIPHGEQRYNTVGDWQFFGGELVVKVSDTGDRHQNLLVGLHEVVEAFLCQARGVKESDVDAFDKTFERESVEEPGEDPQAPYHREHMAADVVERFLALELGVDWRGYTKAVDGLYEKGKKP